MACSAIASTTLLEDKTDFNEMVSHYRSWVRDKDAPVPHSHMKRASEEAKDKVAEDPVKVLVEKAHHKIEEESRDLHARIQAMSVSELEKFVSS